MRYSFFYICLPCRVNDFSLTTRILEIVRVKCGNKEAQIWPYMLQVLLAVPTLDPDSIGFVDPDQGGQKKKKKYNCNFLN
jgi:hypothetical protein